MLKRFNNIQRGYPTVFHSHFFCYFFILFPFFTSWYHFLFSSYFRSSNQWHSNQRGSALLKSFLGSCLIRLKSILRWCVVLHTSIIYQREWQFIRSTPLRRNLSLNSVSSITGTPREILWREPAISIGGIGL